MLSENEKKAGHFGQISPLEIALKIRASRGHQVEQKEAFLEELLVRRELAITLYSLKKITIVSTASPIGRLQLRMITTMTIANIITPQRNLKKRRLTPPPGTAQWSK